MLNFNFLGKGLGVVSSPHFEYDFLRKRVLIFLLTDQIPLSDCLCFLRYWVICILQLFFYMTKKSRQKFKNLQDERSF